MQDQSSPRTVRYSPASVLLTVLSVVFVVEFGVMYCVLPLILPKETPVSLESLLDACLLTVFVSPVFWFVIVRPLRESAAGESARAASIITTAADGIITIDRRETIQSFNPAAEGIFGLAAADVIGGPVAAILSESGVRHFAQLLDTRDGLSLSVLEQAAVEVEGLRRDGSRVPLLVSLSSFRFGIERFVTAIVRDLTAEKQAQAEIRNRVRQQAVIAELGQRALAGNSLNELMNDVARATQTTLSFDVCLLVQFDADRESLIFAGSSDTTELRFRAVPRPLPTAERECWLATISGESGTAEFRTVSEIPSHAMQLELNQRGIRSGISTLIADSDAPFGILIGGRCSELEVTSADRNFFQSAAHIAATAISRERTERERHEKESIRAEQMSVIAQVATGVAHEIRNPLTSIKMLIQMHREWLVKQQAATDDFDVIDSEIRRMEQSLNTFLAYARPNRAESKPIAINDVLQRTARLIDGRCMRQQVTLAICDRASNADGTGSVIEADPAQIQQLLLNLSLNALDAMRSGGRLEISAVVAGDGFVEITVQDSGPGVPDEIQHRIFEPFFTTKETGVGMGLMICRRIAEDHKGRLLLRPSDAGACFVVRLPLHL